MGIIARYPSLPWISPVKQASLAFKVLIYSLVFFAGFANLATEIIGPRLVASLFGSTTIIWAIIISITLIGISLGYFLGGRVPPGRVLRVLPILLVLNAIWLLAVSWLVWKIPGDIASAGYLSITVTCCIAFFPPAVLFSMTSPLVIALLTSIHPPEVISRDVGNIYALGTLGSVLGALAAAFVLIPYVGLSTSLRMFALGALIYAILLFSGRRRWIGLAILLATLFVPQPSYHPAQDFSSVLLEQREGYYQTIRVYSDNQTYIRMDLGPTFHTKMRLSDKEPMYGYATRMLEIAGDVSGKNILIIGGAGHTQARALEKRGATVTEVEIDPFVIQMSDRHFGKINGKVIATDGRTYLQQFRDGGFDLVFVDAFDGLASAPPQLTTREFFEDVNRALAPGGRLLYNFIGIADGPGSNSYRSLASTMGSVFSDTRVALTDSGHLANLVLVASQQPLTDLGLPPAPRGAKVLTDDLNPIEIYFEQARASYYFH
jgi:spermidine synthase